MLKSSVRLCIAGGLCLTLQLVRCAYAQDEPAVNYFGPSGSASTSASTSASESVSEKVGPNKLLALARELERKGSLATAIPLYESAATSENATTEDFMALGDAYVRANRDKDAINIYRRVLAVEPTNYRAQFALGSALLRVGRVNSALIYLEQSVHLILTPQSYSRLGLAHIMVGNPVEALASFEQAYSLNNGGDPDIATNIALAAALAGETERAINMSRELLLNPELQVYHRRNAVLAFAIAGEEEEAKLVAESQLDSYTADELISLGQHIRRLTTPRERATALGMVSMALTDQQADTLEEKWITQPSSTTLPRVDPQPPTLGENSSGNPGLGVGPVFRKGSSPPDKPRLF